MLTAAIMFLLLVVAVWTDLDSHKIYNGNTYTGIALALLIATVNSYWGGGEQMQRLLGSIQLGDAAVGFFICGSIMIVCYVFFSIGGGDVKLIAMLAAFLGLQKGIEAMLWTFIIGGALGLLTILWTGDFRTLVRRFFQRVRSIILLQTIEREEGEEAVGAKPLYLAPSALVAAVIVQFNLLDRLGWI
jgi:prepilin peptidase CpaA